MRSKSQYIRTAPLPKEGQLSIQYARVAKGTKNFDLIYSAGVGCLESDINKLSTLVNKPLWNHPMRYNSDPAQIFKLPNSFLQELEKMGYDLTTLKFSIKLKNYD